VPGGFAARQAQLLQTPQPPQMTSQTAPQTTPPQTSPPQTPPQTPPQQETQTEGSKSTQTVASSSGQLLHRRSSVPEGPPTLWLDVLPNKAAVLVSSFLELEDCMSLLHVSRKASQRFA
jgi:hypothetical protein